MGCAQRGEEASIPGTEEERQRVPGEWIRETKWRPQGSRALEVIKDLDVYSEGSEQQRSDLM